MPAESAADRASFFGADEFGVVAKYMTRGGTIAQITGQFDNPRINVQIGQVVESIDDRPTFTCPIEDLPADALGGDAGDAIEINAKRYRVANIEPDGAGLAVLTLGRAE